MWAVTKVPIDYIFFYLIITQASFSRPSSQGTISQNTKYTSVNSPALLFIIPT